MFGSQMMDLLRTHFHLKGKSISDRMLFVHFTHTFNRAMKSTLNAFRMQLNLSAKMAATQPQYVRDILKYTYPCSGK